MDLDDDLNIHTLTIKNLDTGEKYLIGHNDPKFHHDTFDLFDALEQNPELNSSTRTPETRQKFVPFPLIRYIYRTVVKGSQKKVLEIKETESEPDEPTENQLKISHFRLRKELGRGNFGQVLLAEYIGKVDFQPRIKKGQLFALKIIQKGAMKAGPGDEVHINGNGITQILAERNILAALNRRESWHPFTSNLRFAFQDKHNLYLGLDFLVGGTLKDLIVARGRLSETHARFYASEILLALTHLHSLSVLYRDMKPHNIMLDSRGHCLLIDFGLSKERVNQPKGAFSLVGTPDYSAPELLKTGVYQLQQKQKKEKRAEKEKGGRRVREEEERDPSIGYGPAADWWSFGVLLFEMLFGQPAFRGPDLKATYVRVLYNDPDLSSEVFSDPARSLLLGLLNKNPEQRLGTQGAVQVLRHPFFSGLDWQAVFERREDGPFIPPSQRSRARPEEGEGRGEEEDNEIVLDNEGTDIALPSPEDEGRRERGRERTRVDGWSYLDPSAIDLFFPASPSPSPSTSLNSNSTLSLTSPNDTLSSLPPPSPPTPSSPSPPSVSRVTYLPSPSNSHIPFLPFRADTSLPSSPSTPSSSSSSSPSLVSQVQAKYISRIEQLQSRFRACPSVDLTKEITALYWEAARFLLSLEEEGQGGEGAEAAAEMTRGLTQFLSSEQNTTVLDHHHSSGKESVPPPPSTTPDPVPTPLSPPSPPTSLLSSLPDSVND